MVVTAKLTSTGSRTKDDGMYPLVMKCSTPVPRFFTDIHSDAVATQHSLQAISKAIDFQPVENGFLLQAHSLSSLHAVCSQIWQLNPNSSPDVREFGLWDVELLKNASNENPLHLIRCAHLLCEKIFNRKPTEACKSKSS